MLDIKRIKENPDAIKAGLKAKEVDCDAVVTRFWSWMCRFAA